MSTPNQTLENLERQVESNIGRIVTFVLYPILLPLVGALSFWLQKEAGVDLNPTEATAYIVATVGGLAILGFKWLENRGRFEVAATTAVGVVQAAQAEANAAALPKAPVEVKVTTTDGDAPKA